MLMLRHAMDRGAPVHLVKETLGHANIERLDATFMRDLRIALVYIWRVELEQSDRTLKKVDHAHDEAKMI